MSKAHPGLLAFQAASPLRPGVALGPVDVARARIEGLAETRIGKDATADPVARLEEQEALAKPLAFARRGEPGSAGTDNDDIDIDSTVVRARHTGVPGQRRRWREGSGG